MGLLVAAMVALAGGSAWAQRPTLAVVPFTGPQAKGAEATVVRTLRKKAQLIPASTWKRAAKKLFAATHSSEDIAAVAEDVGAAVVITGIVKKDGRHYELSISIRDGKTGKTKERLKYPLSGPRVPGPTLMLLGRELPEAFDKVAAGGGSEGGDEATSRPVASAPPRPARPAPPSTFTPTPTPPPQRSAPPPVASNEPPPPSPSPSANEPPPPPPPPLSQRGADGGPPSRATRDDRTGKRPRWAPYFDVLAGLSVTGRQFDFDPTSQPRFTSGVVAGVRGDASVYPLAFTWNKAAGVFSGLGLGASIGKPFWPDSSSKQDPTLKFKTSELFLEGGMRWHIVLVKSLPRPQILLNAGGGYHGFSLGKDAMGMDVGPADVAYKYITAGGGLKLNFAEWVEFYATFNYHVVLAAGPITDTNTEYGPANAFGLRVGGGLDFFVYKGLKVGVQGFYERFALTFTHAGTPFKSANGGVDLYFGGVIAVGYVL